MILPPSFWSLKQVFLFLFYAPSIPKTVWKVCLKTTWVWILTTSKLYISCHIRFDNVLYSEKWFEMLNYKSRRQGSCHRPVLSNDKCRLTAHKMYLLICYCIRYINSFNVIECQLPDGHCWWLGEEMELGLGWKWSMVNDLWMFITWAHHQTNAPLNTRKKGLAGLEVSTPCDNLLNIFFPWESSEKTKFSDFCLFFAICYT